MAPPCCFVGQASCLPSASAGILPAPQIRASSGGCQAESNGASAPAPLIRLSALTALDRVRTEFVVAARDFPLGVEVDGLLGLDFFRGLVLTLDFARGRGQ